LADALQTIASMSPSTPRHILVPYDFSETAQHALSFAIGLAEKLGARITVMHAYDLAPPETPGLWFDAELLARLEAGARTALDAAIKRTVRPGVTVDSFLRQGPARSEINIAAKELNVDLIVMGTHGRRGVAHALLGSVAEKIVRTAPCPVVTVQAPTASTSDRTFAAEVQPKKSAVKSESQSAKS
jgi:universal stress protein A